MNVKRKIEAGLLFLFTLSIIITGISAYSTKKLANDSNAILMNNYTSIVHAKNMLKELSLAINDPANFNTKAFENILTLQQANITEQGEKDLTDSISLYVNEIKRTKSSPEIISSVNQLLYKIMELNMKAVEVRNAQAQETAQNAFLYMLISGGLFLLLAIIFISRFPGYIALPIIKRDREKTNFIATVSHEIKTPIAAIKLSTKLLGDERIGTLNPEQKQLIQNIKEDTARVLKITTEVLSMAQMESGKIQLNIHPSDPKQIVDYALEAVHFQAEQKQIKLELNYDETPPVIDADVEKTAWVLVNLLSNAIRYSPENSKISIEIKTNPRTVLFSVQDFGKGIDKKYQDKIFDRYFQVPGSKSGTGLGLAISKQFIEAQEGEIWVDSAVGVGSKFNFTLNRNFLNEIPL
ncbi:MAG: HAMP domain-containing sensor histidine kinase [Bacteroidota bacterium]|nr:HAMP domain-containing sensor histidine kinase [Bacteroidota bacterium]